MSAPPNGDRAAVVRGGALRAVPAAPPAAGRGRRLQDGMAIAADVDARLLGMHLLALRADVVVTPARIAVAATRDGRPADAREDTNDRRTRIARAAAASDARHRSQPDRTTDGLAPGRLPPRRAALARAPVGDGLAAAARALESGAGDLRRARERMP